MTIPFKIDPVKKPSPTLTKIRKAEVFQGNFGYWIVKGWTEYAEHPGVMSAFDGFFWRQVTPDGSYEDALKIKADFEAGRIS